MDPAATETAEPSHVSLRSTTSIFDKLRGKIAAWCAQNRPFKRTIEADESYFGPKRIPGKRGRGAGSKTIVFGILKRQGSVYSEVVPDAKKKTLQGITGGKINLNSTVHSDGWRSYDGLVDVGYDKRYRIKHSDDQFARGNRHINGIESFWSFAKRRLAQFNGVLKKKFYYYLKETDFRFNHRNNNLYAILLQRLREDPL